MNKKILSIGTSIMIIFSVVDFVNAGQERIVDLSVNGMTSEVCPVLLKSAVRKIEGVKSVKASLENHSANIVFDESVVSLETIQDTIESHAGFSTELK